MRVTSTTVPAGHPGRGNEDFAGDVPSAAVLVDGAGIPGADDVCRHGVRWYAQRLGGHLLECLVDAETELAAVLATGIERVTAEHRAMCDTASPVSPSAAVCLLRVRGAAVEYLVLGDAVVVLDLVGGPPRVVTDPREVEVSGSFEAAYASASDDAERAGVLAGLRALRNRPGGFWVAKDDPGAAAEAVTGALEVATVRSAALVSNGASRVVDLFGLADWPGVMVDLARGGAEEVIERVRRAEAESGVPPDDATIVHCTDLAE